MHKATLNKVVLNLLARCKVQREGDSGLMSLPLKLFAHNEVAIVVEDQLVGERIEEEVVVQEFVAPGQMEVDQGQRTLFFHEYIHLSRFEIL